MENKMRPRITGTGFSLPTATRGNDDPIFHWLKTNVPNGKLMFDGYETRHVLRYGEDLMTIMVPAAQNAMKMAGLEPADIDILLGTGSIGDYRTPNQLAELHALLGLPATAWVIPVEDDFSNFNSALIIADSMLKAGHAKNILICIGGNWSTKVDYHTPQSISAGDGAGAAVLSMSDDITKWSVVDHYTISATNYFGSMFMGRAEVDINRPYGYGFAPVPTTFSPNFFQITKEGLKAFGAFGKDTAADAVLKLLEKNDLTGADITFVPHQTSQVLIDHWVKIINPKQTYSTILLIANTTVATHIINLAYGGKDNAFVKDNMVFLALGPDMHANAILLTRG